MRLAHRAHDPSPKGRAGDSLSGGGSARRLTSRRLTSRRRSLGGLALWLAVAGSSGCGGREGEAAGADRADVAAGPEAKPSEAERVAGKKAGEASASKGAPAEGEAKAVVESAVPWFEGELEEAFAQASASGKGVFIDLGAYWCPPCHRLDAELFSRAEVGEAVAADYVPLHVDAERDFGPELVHRYGVDGYPTLLFLDAEGLERGRLVDFHGPTDFLAFMQELKVTGRRVLPALEAELEAKPDDAEVAYRLGHVLAVAGRAEDAERAFSLAIEGAERREDDTALAKLSAEIAYDRALHLTASSSARVRALEALVQAWPKSDAARRAALQLSRLHCDEGREDAAAEALEAMLARAPKDAARVSAFAWSALRSGCARKPATAHLRGALERDREDADLQALFAELSAAAGDFDLARTHIEKAAALEPKRAYHRQRRREFEASRAKLEGDRPPATP